METRVSIVTLGVADVHRSKSFYEALGWQGHELEETVFFQALGQAIVLWDRAKLAADAGINDAGAGTGTGDRAFGGMALAHNVGSPDEVDRIIDTAGRAGGEVTRPPADTFYGGYAGYFRDPDGHVWEVAHNPGFGLGPDGALTLPDWSAEAR